jgi:hypothetical protein
MDRIDLRGGNKTFFTCSWDICGSVRKSRVGRKVQHQDQVVVRETEASVLIKDVRIRVGLIRYALFATNMSLDVVRRVCG